MAHYLIYIPGANGANTRHLESRGLGELCRDQVPDWVECPTGPDGGRGMLCTWRTNEPELDAELEFLSHKQVWKPGPADEKNEIGKGSYWIGHEVDRPPRPRDLIRTEPHPGRPVGLRDGYQWLIPEAIQLPHIVGLDPETGEVALRHAPEFDEFCKASERYAMLLFKECNMLQRMQRANPNKPVAELAVDFPLPEAFRYANMALALNYRVCPPIVDYLGLLSNAEIVRVLSATICFNDILEVLDGQKKTEDAVSIPVG